MPRQWILCLCLLLSLTAAAPGADGVTGVTGLSAHHVAGQTFLSWNELPGQTITYHVYRRADGPITDLAQAERIGSVRQGSSVNVGATRYQGQAGSQKKTLYFTVPGAGALQAGQGLFVWTALRDGPAHYAVAVERSGATDISLRPGQNALAEPVQEAVGLPEPVLQGDSVGPLQGPLVRWYVLWLNWHDTPRLPAMTAVANEGYNFATRGLAPGRSHECLFVSLPGIGGGWWGVADRLPAEYPVLHFGELTHRHGYYFGLHEAAGQTSPDRYPPDSVVQNYAQRYHLYVIRWTKRAFQVDPNRVYLAGVSMGGIGTANLGFSFPDEFAALYIHIPRLHIGDPLWEQETKEVVVLQNNVFVKAWGTFEANFPTADTGSRYPEFRSLTDGMPVFDRTNQVLIVGKFPQVDFPVCLIGCGKKDWTVGWTDKPRFIRAMEDSRHQFFFYWMTGPEERGHNAPFHRCLWPENGYALQRLARYRRDQSYPAVNRLAINDDPGEGLDMLRPDMNVTGEPLGTINGYVDWDTDSIVDDPDQWRVTLRILDVVDRFDDTRGIQQTTADITPRRLQNLRVAPGMRFRWHVLSADGQELQAPREAVADELGLVTLPGVKITRSGSTVVLQRM